MTDDKTNKGKVTGGSKDDRDFAKKLVEGFIGSKVNWEDEKGKKS